MATVEMPKGVRDFLPEQKIVRDRIVSVLQKVFQKYGFNPIETPALEMEKTLVKETDSSSDVFNEMYRLKDQGGRNLVLKYDQTVPFARVVAQNPQLGIPFKRYQIDRAWRDGPIKLGRYREFWQCDVDVAGASSMMADAEYLAMVTDVFKEFEIKVEFKVSNRKLMEGTMLFSGIPKNKWMSAMLIIDKLEKIGKSGVLKEAVEKGIDEDSITKAIDVLDQRGTNKEILDKIGKFVDNELVREGVQELKYLLKFANSFGANLKSIQVSPTLARGLGYYTGTIFEAFAVNSPIATSLAAGGRYDNMVGDFIGKDQKVPAVGISFGLDTIYDVLTKLKKVDVKKTVTQVFIIPIKTELECAKLAGELRQAGINTDLDLIGRAISKNLQYVNKLDIPYALIVGAKELKSNKVNLRDMITGKEELITVNQVIKKLTIN